jgi:L-aspartate oxidase
MTKETDVLIIGCGVAGVISALELSKKGFDVTILSSGASLVDSNSYKAQGGICYRASDESSFPLKEDIIQAGKGLCAEKAVNHLVAKGPDCIKSILLDELQVPFQRGRGGKWMLTKEAVHSKPRILYYGDQTGKAIMEAAFAAASSSPRIHFKFQHTAIDLITLSHHSKNRTDRYAPLTCVGAYVWDPKKERVELFFAHETILATGGVGEVFLHTTNCDQARGDGIAMAFRAGARIMNMEYVQFHPTAFYVAGEPRFLLSEALRGEGGKLLSYEGNPFMEKNYANGDLASRDVVARSIFQKMIETDRPHLWLDISFKNSSWLKNRFPNIYRHCLSRGVDLTKEPLPIVPAAHYSCGGISVDEKGQTTLRRLHALGEVSCSGVHGANRLASTSLLEGLVWAKTCADTLAEEWNPTRFPEVESWRMGRDEVDGALIKQDWMTIKQTMWNYVGLIRSSSRLKRAYKMLSELKWEIDSFYADAALSSVLLGLRNGCETALIITQEALRNRESLGCHFLLPTKEEVR